MSHPEPAEGMANEGSQPYEQELIHINSYYPFGLVMKQLYGNTAPDYHKTIILGSLSLHFFPFDIQSPVKLRPVNPDGVTIKGAGLVECVRKTTFSVYFC